MKEQIFTFLAVSVAFLLLCAPAFSQEVPKPTLVDEFSKIECEDLLARTDHFFAQLENNPAMLGIVVLDQPRNGSDTSRFYRKLIRTNFHRRGSSPDRLRFFRRKTEKPGGSFWLSYTEDNSSFVDSQPWTEPPLDLSRHFVWDSASEEGPCPTFSARGYAELLTAHKNIRGQIVVHAPNRKEALRLGTYWIDSLMEHFDVPRSRLRLIVGKRNKDWSFADFWIVPVKGK